MQFITEYTFPVNGIVILWEIFSYRSTSIILQIWRESISLLFELVDYSTVNVAVGFNRLEAEFQVQAGDVIGW